MDGKITLQGAAYFQQGNVFTGSCTPEQYKANPLAPIFNYRVFMTKDDDGARLIAEHYIGSQCYALTDKESIISADFELSEVGVSTAADYLERKFDEYRQSI